MSGVEIDPIELHLAGDTLTTAADDSTPILAATTGQDCGRGFPGTSAGAHAALAAAWQDEDRALADALRSTADMLHRSAAAYVASDEANATRLQNSSGARSLAPRPALDL